MKTSRMPQPLTRWCRPNYAEERFEPARLQAYDDIFHVMHTVSFLSFFHPMLSAIEQLNSQIFNPVPIKKHGVIH
ncbi:hypothetical protein I7I48_11611 [Histoplasma ohiense]|nr:hypothetical protein I7I48_11611 [Histoplasma ohiense (nom. inval.)]